MIVEIIGIEKKLYLKFVSTIIELVVFILSSSVVEQSAVNRLVVGSSPTWGGILQFTINSGKKNSGNSGNKREYYR